MMPVSTRRTRSAEPLVRFANTQADLWYRVGANLGGALVSGRAGLQDGVAQASFQSIRIVR